MKKIILFISFIFAVLLYSCTPKHDINVNNPESPVSVSRTENPYLVSKEEAFKNLVQIVNGLEPISSRSVNSLKDRLSDISVKDLEVVDNSSTVLSTRTSKTEEMFYLVNFKDSCGYAVLSADKRLPDPVLCIVDEGSISVKDFEHNVLRSSEDSIRKYVPDFKLYDSNIDDYYVGMVQFDDERMNIHCLRRYYMINIDEPYYDSGGYGIAEENEKPTKLENGDWTLKEGVNALLNTKWHQGSPFNDYCPEKRKYWIWGDINKAPAGCVPVAIAQIITYNRFPEDFTVNGIKMDWEAMNKAYDYLGNEVSFNVKTMLSMLIRNIGMDCHAFYTYKWTFTFPGFAANYLETIGYKNVKYRSGKYTDTCIDMIKSGKPVFIAAISDVCDGHGWVLDGYKEYQREVVKKEGDIVVERRKEKRILVHSNFGWEGEADGYYAAGLFDLTKGQEELDNKEIMMEKDITKSNYNFDWAFRIITYDKD